MKYTITILTFLLFFSGCADKNAFSKFNLDAQQELSAANLQSSKIKSAGRVEGIMSAIYLNKIYPNIYTSDEYFYVYFYLKNEKEMYNPNTLKEIKLTMKLNDKLPLKIKELEATNKFSHLTSIQNKWMRYYLVAFEKNANNDINLILQSDQFSSDILQYQKDEE
nr:hypothetical protein [uncultured Sulfurimonas sp.]